MAISAQEAFDELERRKKDLSDVPQETYLDWCNGVNLWLYRRLSSIDPERYLAEQSYSIVPSDNSYALPVDFQTVGVMGAGLFYTNSTGAITDNKLRETSVGSGQIGYKISGSNVIITPLPQTSQTLIMRYIPKIDVITEMTDNFVLDDEYLDQLIDALDVQYDIWDEDTGAEALADQRYVRSLNDIMTNYKRYTGAVGVNQHSYMY